MGKVGLQVSREEGYRAAEPFLVWLFFYYPAFGVFSLPDLKAAVLVSDQIRSTS